MIASAVSPVRRQPSAVRLHKRAYTLRFSQRLLLSLPLRFQLFHELHKLWIAADAVEIRISREVGVTRPAALRRLTQPVYGSFRPAEQRMDRRDVVGGVVKVDEASPFLYRRADVCFGARRVASLHLQDGARARDHAAAIFRMIPQVVLHQIRRFLVPAEIEKSPRDLVIPERLVGFGWHLSELT